MLPIIQEVFGENLSGIVSSEHFTRPERKLFPLAVIYWMSLIDFSKYASYVGATNS